jgi:hypothetical protein
MYILKIILDYSIKMTLGQEIYFIIEVIEKTRQ